MFHFEYKPFEFFEDNFKLIDTLTFLVATIKTWCKTNKPQTTIKDNIMLPHKCPVCDGTGLKSESFYSPFCQGSWTTKPDQMVSCKTCGGTGIVWDPNSKPAWLDLCPNIKCCANIV